MGLWLKHRFTYYSRLIGIWYQTRRNRREIAKAYAPEKPLHIALRPVIISAMIFCTSVAFIGGWFLVRSVLHTMAENKSRSLPLPENTADFSPVAERTTPAVTPQSPVEVTQSAVSDSSMDAAVAEVLKATQDTSPAPDSQLTARLGKYPIEMRYVIIANKATKTMYILHNQESVWGLLTSWRMAIGENSGQKKNAGDKRTPEGTYFIIGRHEKNELAEIYGPLAYVLNYPNNDDVRAGRTGQGIWIHGTKPDSVPVSTKGCLELDNSNLLQLSEWLRFGIGTPVLVINDPRMNDPLSIPDFAMLTQKRRTVFAECLGKEKPFVDFLLTWKSAWESKDIRSYEQLYDVNAFIGQGMDWPAWREKKRRTFEVYRRINVDVENVILVNATESTAVLSFVQHYSSDKNQVENGKKLRLVKDGNQWKISREDTFSKEELAL